MFMHETDMSIFCTCCCDYKYNAQSKHAHTCVHTAIIANWSLFKCVKSVFWRNGWSRWTSLSPRLRSTISQLGKERCLTEWMNSLCKKRNKLCKPHMKHRRPVLALTVTRWSAILRNCQIIGTVICMLNHFASADEEALTSSSTGTLHGYSTIYGTHSKNVNIVYMLWWNLEEVST